MRAGGSGLVWRGRRRHRVPYSCVIARCLRQDFRIRARRMERIVAMPPRKNVVGLDRYNSPDANGNGTQHDNHAQHHAASRVAGDIPACGR